MKNIPFKNTSRGFTLIELMIASAIFVIIVMVGTEILVTATNNYSTTSEVRQSLDTLNFVMEDMTRNLRLGTDFNCGNLGSIAHAFPCPAASTFGEMEGSVIAFTAQDGAGQIVYWLYSPTTDPTKGVLYKMSETNTPPAPQNNSPVYVNSPFSEVTPTDMFIDLTKSGFSISNPPGDVTPLITIRLAGTVQYQSTTVPFDMQSTVAPRDLPNL